MKKTSYMFSPIIVLGAGHSGTRAIVDVLSALGSHPGDVSNNWRENTFFLSLHEELLGVTSNADWRKKIFTNSKIQDYKPTKPVCDAVRYRIERELLDHYPRANINMWHWKCPTSAYFLDYWKSVYPDAYYIHIVRDRYAVAESLMRRREFHGLRAALNNTDEMNHRIETHEFNRYLKVDYDNFPNEIDNIVDFIPEVTGSVNEAKSKFQTRKTKPFSWDWSYSIQHNLWKYWIAKRIIVHKKLGV